MFGRRECEEGNAAADKGNDFPPVCSNLAYVGNEAPFKKNGARNAAMNWYWGAHSLEP